MRKCYELRRRIALLIVIAILFTLTGTVLAFDDSYVLAAPETSKNPDDISGTNSDDNSSEGHVHEYGEWEYYDETHHRRQCSYCIENDCDVAGASEYEEHEPYLSVWIVDEKPTATEPGTQHQECNVCKQIVVRESIPALGEKPGNSEEEPDDPDHVHEFSEYELKSDANGHWLEGHCTVEGCKNSENAKSEIEAHEESDWIIDKEPSTTEPGHKKRICNICHHMLDAQDISVLPVVEGKPVHVHVFDKGKWKFDETHHWHEYCLSKDCDDPDPTTVKSELEEHDSGKWEDVSQPKETEDGLQERRCTVCNYLIESDTIPALGEDSDDNDSSNKHEHTFSSEWKYNENNHWHEGCSTEGCDFAHKLTSGVAAHDDGEWVITTESTTTETGIQTRFCTVCKYAMETAIAPVKVVEPSTDPKPGEDPNPGENPDDNSGENSGDSGNTGDNSGNTGKDSDDDTSGNEHTHEFSTEWKYDETNHWHVGCLAEDCEDAYKLTCDVEPHEPDTRKQEATETEDGFEEEFCKICDYIIKHDTIPATGTDPDPKPDPGTNPNPNPGENPDDNSGENSGNSGDNSDNSGNTGKDPDDNDNNTGKDPGDDDNNPGKNPDDNEHVHKFDESKWKSNADGHWHEYCIENDCDDPYSVKGDVEVHQPVERIIVEATETEDGSKEVYCEICDYVIERDVRIPATGTEPGTDPDPGTKPDPDPGVDPDPKPDPDPGVDPDPGENPDDNPGKDPDDNSGDQKPDAPSSGDPTGGNPSGDTSTGNNPSGGNSPSGGSSNQPSGGSTGGSSSSGGSSNRPSGGGSTGGSSTGGGSTANSANTNAPANANTPTTTTTKNPDGSTTTTTVNTTTGVKTETTEKPNGSVTAVQTQSDGTVATTETSTTGQVKVTVVLSAKAMSAAGNKPILLPIAAVPVTTNPALAQMITISAANSGVVKVKIPLASIGPGVVAIIVNPDGSMKIVTLSVVMEDGLVLSVPSGTTIKIVDNSGSFADVATGGPSHEAVSFMSARGLMVGTSADAFSPTAPMNCAMMATVLARLDGADLEGGATWYEKSMSWAAQSGINSTLAPNENVSREQLVTMVWRYVGSPNASNTLSGYADAAQVSDSAAGAMRWAVENGIIHGNGTGLNPQGQATRAEAAIVFQNLLTKLAQ